VLAIAVGIAFLANAAFGVSLALGAFLAGLAVGESDLSQRAAENALPLRDAFAVLFFVSVGMLFQPMRVLDNLPAQGLVLAVVLVATPLTLFLIARGLRQTTSTATLLALAFAQVGEFSFIVGELAMRAGLLPETAQNLIVTASIASITLNPFLFRWIPGGGGPSSPASVAEAR
jgi:CPA2 family monovalent cation:H+ antiporter-2